jgi:hypothetical protein
LTCRLLLLLLRRQLLLVWLLLLLLLLLRVGCDLPACVDQHRLVVLHAQLCEVKCCKVRGQVHLTETVRGP